MRAKCLELRLVWTRVRARACTGGPITRPISSSRALAALIWRRVDQRRSRMRFFNQRLDLCFTFSGNARTQDLFGIAEALPKTTSATIPIA